METLPIDRLERYSLDRPQEVLLLRCTVDGEPDEILVYKGYSSSTVRPTAFDLGTPVLPPDANIETVSRLKAPYQPNAPQALEADIPWSSFSASLTEAGY